jgi:hypothetical protein
MRPLAFLLCIWTVACSDASNPPGADPDGNVATGSADPALAADGGSSPMVDAPAPRSDGRHVDADPNIRFLTDPPPYPDCPPDIEFHPEGGYSGLVNGQRNCGPASPNCPTTYIDGNSGAPCASASDCTGKDPVCLISSKYPGGVCAATGCEIGSNFGCPRGAYCLNADGQTYCIEGCGIDQRGCFRHCSRTGYACFTSESKYLGYCLGADGARDCDPSASASCTMPEFGDGVCGQTAWDDQSIGNCFETCDVYAQDCSEEGRGCYLLFDYPDYPVCFQSQGEPEGSTCVRTTECAEGLRCSCDNGTFPCTSTKHCRKYCSSDGNYPCPVGSYCRALADGGNLGSCEPI